MPSPDFIDRVLAVVRRIPAGRVMTYGDIAEVIGSNAPRAVGRVLAEYGHSVTWWRVVPASGLPPQGHARDALPRYLSEGTPLRHTDQSPVGADQSPVGADPAHYRIALSQARLGYAHPIYAEVAP